MATFFYETHSHSKLSDGGNTPAEMLSAAEAKGMKVFTLTDHFDIHEHFPAQLSCFDGAGRDSSYRQMLDLKHSHDIKGSPTKFMTGIEIGQGHQFRDVANNWLDVHEYDMVIGACHIIRGHIDFYHMDYDRNPPKVVLKQYFAELIEMCTWCCERCCEQVNAQKRFDTLAHMTYPVRYIKANVDLSDYSAQIDELFEIMVKNEIALEINTGKALMNSPDLPQLRRYRELGGRLLTLGSDCHSVDRIAYGLESAVEMAKAAGFSECVYFEKRKPVSVKL